MNTRIRELRKELNLTLEEFGKRLGVTKTAISRLENGERNITEQMIKSICREFSVDYMWLTTGAGEMFIKMDSTDIAFNHFGYIMGNATAQKKAVLSALVEMVYCVPDDKWDYIFNQFESCLKEASENNEDGGED